MSGFLNEFYLKRKQVYIKGRKQVGYVITNADMIVCEAKVPYSRSIFQNP
jgi:hypothetical protein